MIVRCRGEATWRAERDPDSGRWVAVSDDLNLATEADTWKDLQVEIYEAMMLLFRDLLKHGELEAFFMKRGWECDVVPENIRPEDVQFDVAAPILPAWIIANRSMAGSGAHC